MGNILPEFLDEKLWLYLQQAESPSIFLSFENENVTFSRNIWNKLTSNKDKGKVFPLQARFGPEGG